jgi:hypothetical protein
MYLLTGYLKVAGITQICYKSIFNDNINQIYVSVVKIF